MNRITVAQIEAFYWTATLGSVEAAARRLNLTQPSISLRLKTLQAQLGQPVLERRGRGLGLTPRGQELLPHATLVLNELETMMLRPDPAAIRGPVRIGMAEGLALVCLPHLIQSLHRRYPRLKLELSVGTSAALEPVLHDHGLDIAFLVEPVEAADFTLVSLGIQQTSWIASPRWDLPEVVTPHDLATCAIITNAPNSINFRQIQSWFASAGLTPPAMDTCNSVAMLAHLVGRGVGLGILPVKMFEADLAEGRVRILTSNPAVADTPIHAKYPTLDFGPATRAVLGEARQILASLGYISGQGSTG